MLDQLMIAFPPRGSSSRVLNGESFHATGLRITGITWILPILCNLNKFFISELPQKAEVKKFGLIRRKMISASLRWTESVFFSSPSASIEQSYHVAIRPYRLN